MKKIITQTTDVALILQTLMDYKYWGCSIQIDGIDPFTNKIELFQIGNRNEQFLIDTKQASLEPLRTFFESRNHYKIFHGANFPYKMFRSNYNIMIESMRCTWITEKVLQGGRFLHFTLKDLLSKRLGLTVDHNIMNGNLLEDLYTNQCNEGILIGLASTIILENEAIPAFADMEFDGMYLDVPAWRAVLEANKQSQIAVQEELESWTLKKINLASSQQVLQMLNDMGVKTPVLDPKTKTESLQKLTSTDAKYLQRISDNPIIKLLVKWRSYNTLISTFGESYIEAIHPKTGKIHMNLDQIGAATGRPTTGESDVNPLNIPKENRYRSCFVGGPNEVVESDDYSGCEPRILGEISKDPRFVSIFQKREDIHSSVGTELYGIPISKTNENARYREPAKAINIGIIYGRGVDSIYQQIIGSGFKISYEDTVKAYNTFCSKYSVAVNYLRREGELATKQGYLTNLNGRRRYWILPNQNNPKYKWIMSQIRREGANFKIQSVNADITKQAMIWNRDFVTQNKVNSSTMNVIYDEIVTRTNKDQSEAYHFAKQEIMIKAAERWLKTVPMEVDGVVRPYWTK